MAAGERDGLRAWVYVLASFYIHFVVFGVMQSFGVIYVELIDHFDSSRSDTAWIGSLLSGLVLLLGPVDVYIQGLVGLRATAVLGSILACVGCSISFLANSLTFLYLSYGVLQGLGFSLMFVTATVVVNQHFERRRSLANAIASTGGGVGSFALPPLLQLLMTAYSWRGALLITGGLSLNCAVFAILFQQLHIEGEKEIENTNIQHDKDGNKTKRKVTSWLLIKFRVFLSTFTSVRYTIFLIGAVIGALSYLIPFNHLLDLANTLNIHDHLSTWLLSTIGVSSIAGRIVFGRISDIPTVNRVTVVAIASIIVGAATMACPVLDTFPMLMVYSVVFGLFIGVWMSLQPVAVGDIVGVEKLGEGFGNVIFFQGIVMFLGSPMAGWLYDVSGNYRTSFYVGGGCFCLGGMMILAYELLLSCSQCHGKYSIEEHR